MTDIEWTDITINPIRAVNLENGKRGWFCVHHSRGCTRCYAERINRWRGNGLEYIAQNADKVRFELDEDVLLDIYKRKKPAKVFPCDMTDLFYEGIPDHNIIACLRVFAQCRQHTIQILTKRIDRCVDFLCTHNFRLLPNFVANNPHIWWGTSVEDQMSFDKQGAHLRRLQDLLNPRVTFLSYEPAIGAIDFQFDLPTPPPKWVIVGGESGQKARECEIEWIEATIRQCRIAGIPLFVKQLGSNPVARKRLTLRGLTLIHKKGGNPEEWPKHLRIREFPQTDEKESRNSGTMGGSE